jgi:hypothetical protein
MGVPIHSLSALWRGAWRAFLSSKSDRYILERFDTA